MNELEANKGILTQEKNLRQFIQELRNASSKQRKIQRLKNLYINQNSKNNVKPIQRLLDKSDSDIDKESNKKISKIPSLVSENIPIRSIDIPNQIDDKISEDHSSVPSEQNRINTLVSSKRIKNSIFTSTPKSPRIQVPTLSEEDKKSKEINTNINPSFRRKSIPTKRKLDYVNSNIESNIVNINNNFNQVDQPLSEEPEIQIENANFDSNKNQLNESEDDPSKYKMTIRKSSKNEVAQKISDIRIIPTEKRAKKTNQDKLNVSLKSKEEVLSKKLTPKPKTRNKPNKNEINDQAQCLRRSKRAKIDPTQKAIYKFERINGVIVSTLAETTKKKFIPSEELEVVFKKKKLKKASRKNVKPESKKEKARIESKTKINKQCNKNLGTKVKERISCAEETLDIKLSRDKSINTSQETVFLEYENEHDHSIIENEIKLYTFNRNNEERDYIECTEGVSLAALSEKDALMRIDPGGVTITNKHEFWTTYFLQEGKCLLSLNGISSKHTKADIFIVPKNVPYKIKNLSKTRIAYLYFMIDN